MEEQDYWLAWSLCPGVGPVRFRQLIQIFGSAERAWLADKTAFKKQSLSGRWVEMLFAFKEKFQIDPVKERLAKSQLKFVCHIDNDYPIQLNELEDAPIGLFICGNFKSLRETLLVAIVGTRKVTDYGRQVTHDFGYGLAKAGVGVVSGLMYGVDEIAHRACVEADGLTVGVWAGGLDTLFTGSRKGLAELILHNGGVLMSEFPPGLLPTKGTFPLRNRIVAGLAKGVIVTEGSANSGTLITAGFAASQGKDVFAVPGPITSAQSQAPAQLIKAGATLVTSVQDVLDQLEVKAEISIDQFAGASDDELQILTVLFEGGYSTDELARSCKKVVTEISLVLTTMELQGWIRREGERWFVNRR